MARGDHYSRSCSYYCLTIVYLFILIFPLFFCSLQVALLRWWPIDGAAGDQLTAGIGDDSQSQRSGAGSCCSAVLPPTGSTQRASELRAEQSRSQNAESITEVPHMVESPQIAGVSHWSSARAWEKTKSPCRESVLGVGVTRRGQTFTRGSSHSTLYYQ